MAEHTPGPWEAYLPGRKFVIPVRNFHSVCELTENERPPEVVDANARLIAAAPDLLAACKRALHLVEENNEEVVEMVGAFGLYADLKAVINKAEGR